MCTNHDSSIIHGCQTDQSHSFQIIVINWIDSKFVCSVIRWPGGGRSKVIWIKRNRGPGWELIRPERRKPRCCLSFNWITAAIDYHITFMNIIFIMIFINWLIYGDQWRCLGGGGPPGRRFCLLISLEDANMQIKTGCHGYQRQVSVSTLLLVTKC